MKQRKHTLLVFIGLAVSLPLSAQNTTHTLLPTGQARADDVPAGEGGRHYIPGASLGKDNITPSSYSSRFTIGANFKAGFNNSCGDLNFFNNFKAELKRLQYKLKNTIKDAQRALMASASSAVGSFFQFALMKINPTLGQLTTKHLDEYIEVFELNVKQCRDYERDIANGKNPLSEIVQIAVGEQWKTTIGMVNEGEIALEEAQEELIREAQKRGVEMADGKRYGGENQAPINITQSLIKAGMNLIMARPNKASWDSDFSTDAQSIKNNPILKEFKNPQQLYAFVEEIYGAKESRMTSATPTGEQVQTVAGRGYELKYVDYRNEFYEKLRSYIFGKIDRQTFEKETGHLIPLAEVDDIKQMPPYEQAVDLEYRSQQYAIGRMRANLLFAKQALKTGIYAPDLQQSGMKKMAEAEYKDLYYRILEDIREIGQRAYQY